MAVDVVIWDSHPLALGATPQQVFIDGIPQLEKPHTNRKPAVSQTAPNVPNFDKEREAVLQHDGLPPLKPAKTVKNVIFENVRTVFLRDSETNAIVEADLPDRYNDTVVIVRDGKMICIAIRASCLTSDILASPSSYEYVDLEGGSISPSLVTFGSDLGIAEIASEKSTQDGTVLDPFKKDIPSILGGDGLVIQAVDGLVYATRNAL